MENEKYNTLLENNIESLADISNVFDLVKYQHDGRYLIEYLLENNIHSARMDNIAVRSSRWINFYLKYNQVEPLIYCHLIPLLSKYQGRVILDILLEKISDTDKMRLFDSIKKNSYWDYHNYEDEVIDIYLKHGIKLPKIFVKSIVLIDNNKTSKRSEELISDFCETFKDQDNLVLKLLTSEINKRLKINYKRAYKDVQKLILYKKHNPLFNIKLSNDTEGLYNKETSTIILSPYRFGVSIHEFSHLFYDAIDEDTNYLEEYENIRKNIDNPSTVERIYHYLIMFHKRFYGMKELFGEFYDRRIINKYHSYENYLERICKDVLEHKVEVIRTNGMNTTDYFINNSNIKFVIGKLLNQEREEYINNSLRNYYSEELMLENLLDSLLKGKIHDNAVVIECLSGHRSLDFMEEENLSLDETLADYDMIKNSSKAKKLISDLKMLVGDDLINFLDNYLMINRENSHFKK